MKVGILLSTTVLGMAMSFASSSVLAHESVYEVTITNLTKNIVFTPILVASHYKGVKIFTLGHPASDELGRIAEGGDIGPMADALDANSKVIDVSDSGGPLGPGHSVTVEVSAKHGGYVTVASMMLPTNDGFIALNGVQAPKHNHGKRTVYSPGYDAGTETNDELCAHIPGPPDFVCTGEAFSPDDDGEGYVHINSGISGIGDLMQEKYDWRNPVAAISIKQVRKD